jgi:hypothetical protein
VVVMEGGGSMVVSDRMIYICHQFFYAWNIFHRFASLNYDQYQNKGILEMVTTYFYKGLYVYTS